jgi:hypothetical protein
LVGGGGRVGVQVGGRKEGESVREGDDCQVGVIVCGRVGVQMGGVGVGESIREEDG